MVFKDKISQVWMRSGSVDQELVSRERLSDVLDSIDQGVVFYSKTGQQQFCNNAAAQMNIPHGRLVQDRLHQSGENSFYLDQTLNKTVSGKVVDLGDDGFLLVTKPEHDQCSETRKLFAHLMRKPSPNTDPFAHAARALGLACDWRWVGVSRFSSDTQKSAEFKGWWDGVMLKPGFSVCATDQPYKLLCIDEFKNISADVIKSIELSGWQISEQGPVQAFAGLVYCVNETPFGHIVALDTKPRTNVGEMEAMQCIVADYLTTVDGIDCSAVAPVIDANSIDPLTQFGDRHILNAKKRQLVNAFLKGTLSDLLIVDIELRQLDSWRADADDASILACAEMTRKACRPSDWFFRPSKNRFQLLLPGLSAAERENTHKRIANAARQMQGLSYCVHEIDYGMSCLSEHNGKIEQAELLAAESRQDMSYQHRAMMATKCS
jgi:GGDEF domain-containing protein